MVNLLKVLDVWDDTLFQHAFFPCPATCLGHAVECPSRPAPWWLVQPITSDYHTGLYTPLTAGCAYQCAWQALHIIPLGIGCPSRFMSL